MGLGWQQREILKRLLKNPGISTTELMGNDLSKHNKPHTKLEDAGFIQSNPLLHATGMVKKHRWYITEKGKEVLARRSK